MKSRKLPGGWWIGEPRDGLLPVEEILKRRAALKAQRREGQVTPAEEKAAREAFERWQRELDEGT